MSCATWSDLRWHHLTTPDEAARLLSVVRAQALLPEQVTIFSEQQINTTVSNVRRIESNTIYGKNLIRIFFQPNVRIDQAVSQITATSQTIIRRMPLGRINAAVEAVSHDLAVTEP